jgi:glutathione-regulated potassium-efflux system protein KefB
MTLLTQTALFLGAALFIVPLCHRFGLATVLGYLITGIIIGPNLLNLAGNAETVLHFAEFGVVMLLFLIGLELRAITIMGIKTLNFCFGWFASFSHRHRCLRVQVFMRI